MALSSVLFLFLTHLGIGVAWSLLLVSRDAGVKFFRFNAALALVVLAAGALLRAPDPAAAGLWARIAPAAVAAAAVGLFVYWVIVGRAAPRARPWLLGIAGAAGLVAIAGQGLAVSEGAPALWRALTVASFGSSAALLGSSCTAMVLGHWYLVLPSLDVAHLQRVVLAHIVSVGVRIAVVAAAVLAALLTWEARLPPFDRYVWSVDGVFFWQRVLFGLFGPAVLAYLTWETAKIRSTQSATGILYVDFFTVIVGEVLAKYLVLATRVPV